MRTIFLAVRGIDQTGRAFSVIDRRIEKLIQQQMKFSQVTRTEAKKMVKEQHKLLFAMRELDRASYRLIFAGAAFLAFAGMMVWGLGNIISTSSMGELYMEDFSRAWNKLSIAVSEAILENWGPAIQAFIKFLDDLAKNEMFKMIVGEAAVPVTIVLGVLGIGLLVAGLIGKFITGLIALLEFAGYFDEAATVKSTAAGALHVTLPITVAFAVVLALVVLKKLIGPTLKEQILSTIKKPKWIEELPEWLEWLEIFFWNPPKGSPLPRRRYGVTKQLGTTILSKTGPIIAHAGEWIFNPQLPISPPPQMLGGGVGGGPIVITVNQHIDSVGVEADETRLAEKTAEYIGDKIAEMMG